MLIVHFSIEDKRQMLVGVNEFFLTSVYRALYCKQGLSGKYKDEETVVFHPCLLSIDRVDVKIGVSILSLI